MRFRRIEAYLILGCYLAVGAFLGYSIEKEKPVIRPDTFTVDVVKEGNEILIYEHYSRELVFEYTRDVLYVTNNHQPNHQPNHQLVLLLQNVV